MKAITISEIHKNDTEPFFAYLKKHISENGRAGNLFLPLAKDQLKIDDKWRQKFMNGLSKEFGDPDWRKLWVAKNAKEEILGHVDIRFREELNTQHRVLLGMGVDFHFRRLHIGQQLVKQVVQYGQNNPHIAWIDLEVMSKNQPAIALYLKNNFEVTSNCVDMFRIENKSYDYTSMTLNVIKQ